MFYVSTDFKGCLFQQGVLDGIWNWIVAVPENCPVTVELTHFILETPKGVLAKSADPDQMPHNVASDLGLHYFASCSTIFQQKYLN